MMHRRRRARWYDEQDASCPRALRMPSHIESAAAAVAANFRTKYTLLAGALCLRTEDGVSGIKQGVMFSKTYCDKRLWEVFSVSYTCDLLTEDGVGDVQQDGGQVGLDLRIDAGRALRGALRAALRRDDIRGFLLVVAGAPGACPPAIEL